jgi:hypothetical protein
MLYCIRNNILINTQRVGMGGRKGCLVIPFFTGVSILNW